MKFFVFLSVLMWALVWSSAGAAQTAVVVDGSRVNMRSGKADNYRLIRVLPPKSVVQVVESDQEYAKVKASDGETGWVPLNLLIIHKTDAEKLIQSQADLDAAQKALVAARVELANGQREMEEVQKRPGGGASTSFLLMLGMGAFVCGAAVGALALWAYYQKRLQGLRI